MKADQVHLMPPACFENRVGIELTQQKMQASDGCSMGHRVGDTQNRLAYLLRIGRRGKRERPDPLSPDLDDGHVDAVERGAAHDAGDLHWARGSGGVLL